MDLSLDLPPGEYYRFDPFLTVTSSKMTGTPLGYSHPNIIEVMVDISKIGIHNTILQNTHPNID